MASPPNPINLPFSFSVYILVIIATFLIIFLITTLLIYLCQGTTAESPWQCLTCWIGRRPSAAEMVAIPVCAYKKEQSFSSECSVCLTALQDGEEVRQLPSCRHSFHAPCVDMWLRTHPSCPSWRAPVLQAGRQRIEGVEDSSLEQQQISDGAVTIFSDI